MKMEPDAIDELHRLQAMAVLQRVQDLAESYLDVPRVCFVCRDAPAVSPMVFVAGVSSDGRAHGSIFALCGFCLCRDDCAARVNEALKEDMHEREMATWN